MSKILIIIALLLHSVTAHTSTISQLGLINLKKYTKVKVKDGEYAHPAFINLFAQLQRKKLRLNQVTEAYPPTVRHSSRNHYNGRAIDLTVLKYREASKICNWINKQVGFYCLNEYEHNSRYKTGPHLHVEYRGI